MLYRDHVMCRFPLVGREPERAEDQCATVSEAECLQYSRTRGVPASLPRVIDRDQIYALAWSRPSRHGDNGNGRSSGGRCVTRIPTDPEQIRQLAAVMAENGLTEVELADKDTSCLLYTSRCV